MSARGHHGLMLAGDEGDPYWSSVVSLLSCGGSLGDAVGKVWTAAGAAGAASIVADANTFTGYSCYLNGGWLTTPSSADFDFGKGDFTIEMFVRFISHDAFGEFFIRRASNSGVTPFSLAFLNTTDTITDALSVDGVNWAVNQTSASALAANARQHIAMCRKGASLVVYVGGVAAMTSASGLGTSSLMPSTQALSIGGNTDGTQKIKGYIDQFRITKGVARYTANFTPPTKAFPTHA